MKGPVDWEPVCIRTGNPAPCWKEVLEMVWSPSLTKLSPVGGGHAPSNSLNSAQGLKEAGSKERWAGEPLVSCCAQVLRSPRLEEVELWSPRERGRQWRREINNLKDRFSGF